MFWTEKGRPKFITLEITGARTKEEADLLAKTVATSPLVKTAFFGMDANWGRILAALGRSGVSFDPDQVDLYFNRVQVVRKGLSAGLEKERQAGKILKNRSLTVRIDLHQGQARTLRLYLRPLPGLRPDQCPLQDLKTVRR